ncbi:MAG TPA: DUF2630 family protein [Bacteroidia bacterium]|jgi:hypothetical protein|nr:DUF2630 family protein [Bacteroidia bacterium]
MENNPVLMHIEKLTLEEQQLYAKGSNLTDEEVKRLHKIKVELDQYWDLLRQREALQDAGKNPDKASIRPEGTVENYEQ